MAGYNPDHQLAGPGPQPVSGLVSLRRPAAGIAAPHAARAGSPGWMSRGACRGEDPELFFPIAAAAPALAQVRSAKAVCGRCPVQPDCLSYALVTGQADGIWGGTTTEERWPARRPRRGDQAASLPGLPASTELPRRRAAPRAPFPAPAPEPVAAADSWRLPWPGW